ncbi:MAG: sodium-dependent transporter [Muribaculaceae bacterium]|jgi:NSS family neurotransmitter:Na+ symporter|nr:sodium-dependent transporter [Muribaculaceae bacterium]MEE1338981.1 sodium-dependent transporter [Muribaculaceae bacterium]
MAKDTTFSSKFGLIAATVGSAVGLGNVWRFPSLAQENGGGAFLLVYICCIFILGIPVMLAEFSLGRAGRSDSVGSFKNLTPGNKWWIAGCFGLVASYLILAFYMVVAGWTIEYLWQSISGGLFEGFNSASSQNTFFADKMKSLILSGSEPIFWTFAMIVLNLVILLKGVKKGIEKISNILMPLLFVILLIFCAVSLSLPNASEGLKFFLTPDFDKINSQVIVAALGQAFFSLSLGMGILVTYSSYFPKTIKMVRTSVTVTFLDFMVSVLMGIIIFPAVISFGISGSENMAGMTLVFVTLPEIFAQMGGSQWWSALFFLLLGVAAITSTISIAEVSIAFVHDRFRISRKKACFIVLLPLFLFSTLCSVSLTGVEWLQIANLPLFDALDKFTANMVLPASALLICLYVGWVLPKNFLKDELTNYGTFRSPITPVILFLIKFVCPALIAIIFLANFIKI